MPTRRCAPMTDPTCSATPGDHVLEHEQPFVVARTPAPVHSIRARGLVYPCAVPGVSLTDYSLNPAGKGWGSHCAGPFTTVTLNNGVRFTVDSRIAELITLLGNATLARGYEIRQVDT